MRGHHWLPLLTFLAAMLAAELAPADHPSAAFGGGAGGPINTIPAYTLPRGKTAVAARLDYVNFDRFSDSELLALDAQGIDTDSVDYGIGGFLSLARGVTDDVTMAVRLPYIYLDDIREPDGMGEVSQEGDSAGLGDLLFLGFFKLLDRQNETLQLTLVTGLEVPTGRINDLTLDGDLFEADHQAGSGSVDPWIGLAVSKQWERVSLHGNVLYAINTPGSQFTDLGDILTYNVALVRRLGRRHAEHAGHQHAAGGGDHDHHDHEHHDHEHEHGVRQASYTHPNSPGGMSQTFAASPTHAHGPTLDLILELNGFSQNHNRVSGVIDPNTGGDLLYLSPGFRLTLRQTRSVFFSGGIPIYQDPNGANHRADYRLIVGSAVVF